MIHVVDDPRYREHRSPAGHPERPERLAAVAEALASAEEPLVRVPPRPAALEELARVHDPALVHRIARASQSGPGHLDADTYVSPRSYEIALLAAGATIDLAGLVARGEARVALAAVRPPGHHAEADRAMGFCLFNNVAVAARALQAEHRLEKILLVDFDVHHGNGTQHCFQDDPRVLYFSIHQFPFYPGTGAFSERGTGPGEGTTVNLPLPPGCGDTEYLGAMQRVLVPVARAYQPQLILVSAGFDAHRDDPLASMNVTRSGYHGVAAILRALADDLCEGRLVYVLEGGYAASGLRDGVGAVLETLGDHPPDLLEPTQASAASELARLLDGVRAVHGSRYPEIGAS